MLSIGFPLGLWALVSVPALLALYFLRRRTRPRTVSAAFLWRDIESPLQAGPRWRRLEKEKALLLELLAVLALVAFLADVRCANPQDEGSHIVVVLDGSFSMLAHPQGEDPVFVKARKEARARMASHAFTTLLETGVRPRVLAGPAATRDEAMKALEKWRPSQPSHDLSATLVLARELAGPGGEVLLLSDGLSADETPKGVERVAVGSPLKNSGLVSASRVDDDQRTVLHLEVRGDATQTITSRLTVTAASTREILATRPLVLEAGTPLLLRLELPRQEVVIVELPSDVLVADDRIELVPNATSPVTISNRLPARRAARKSVSRFVQATRDVRETGEVQLVFSAPSDKTSQQAVLIGSVGGPSKRNSYLGPFVGNRQHPVLEDLSFDGVVWTAGLSPPGRPLLSAGDTVLISLEPPGRLHINIDLSRSSVERTQAWPMLLANAVDLRRRSLPGFARHNVVVGDSIDLVVGDGKGWRLRGPDLELPLQAGHRRWTAPTTGIWTLRHDGQTIDQVGVTALDANESDLSTRSSGRSGEAATGDTGTGSPRRRALLALAVALIALLADFGFAAPGRRRGLS